MKFSPVVLIVVSLFFSAYAQEKTPFIYVSGTAEVKVKAEQINFNIAVRTVEPSIEQSKQVNNKALDKLLKTLSTAGIKDDDIEVSPATLGKNYEYNNGKQELKGYFTNVNVIFKLRELSKYFDLSDQLSQNEQIEVTNSSYDINDYPANNRIAYEQALKAAKEKANYMAAALGVKLGKVLEIQDETSPQVPIMYNAKRDFTAENSVESGKVTIGKSVNVKFEIIED